jgi:DNA-binding response OmpR family regulator
MPQTILIVDDEPNIVIPLQFLMEKNGYTVMVASSGEEAIETILKNKPDLILLDIMLHGIDGFEVCQIVRANPEWKDIKVIFVTALGRDVDVAKGMAIGADGFIKKPFSNKEIIEKARNLLNGTE